MTDGEIKLKSQKMLVHTEAILRLWLVDDDKKGTLEYYNRLTIFERILFLEGLREIISASGDAEFRQAAKDIPKYISKESTTPV